jgi:hypothetical protein
MSDRLAACTGPRKTLSESATTTKYLFSAVSSVAVQRTIMAVNEPRSTDRAPIQSSTQANAIDPMPAHVDAHPEHQQLGFRQAELRRRVDGRKGEQRVEAVDVNHMGH